MKGRPFASCVALVWPCAVALVACNGTTGREGIPAGQTGDDAAGDAAPGDATVADAADAGVWYDTGAFDVEIFYADRALPDVSAPPEGGAAQDAASGLPSCPPWIPVDSAGTPVPLNDPAQFAFIPSDYTADGGIGPALDGGACATHKWYPFLDAFNEKWAYDTAGDPVTLYNPFPPCNWAVDAGVAQAGTMSMQSRYTLCMNLYECIAQTGCELSANGIPGCYCGMGDAGVACLSGGGANPQGPCKDQEIAGFEVPASQDVGKYLLGNFGRSTFGQPPVPPYINVSGLNYLYAYARSQKLYPDGGP